ncbi:MAG: AEC family transporter [Velocimicrobium sp.]
MDVFWNMMSLQIVLLIYLLAGMFAKKKEIITKENQSKFIDFVLQIIMPCMVFQSFNQNLTWNMMKQAMTILMVSFGICFFSMLLGKIIYRGFPFGKRSIMQYATLINNAGFAGLPMTEGIYGNLGLFYASIAIVPNRIFMWSAGISLFTTADFKTKVKNVILNPNIIAVFLGLIRAFCGTSLPLPLDKALTNMGNMVAPMAMIVVGAILAEVNIKTVIEPGVLFVSAIRLIILPVVCVALLHLLPIDETARGVSLILTSMPAGTTTALLAAKYGADVEFASKCVFVTTMLSLITVPCMMLLL